jgi:hypothetical protein
MCVCGVERACVVYNLGGEEEEEEEEEEEKEYVWFAKGGNT